MSDRTDLQALSDRSLFDWTGYPGIEVRWLPVDYSHLGHWMIKLAVAWQGKSDKPSRRRWVEVRGETLTDAVIRAEEALDKEGR
jgi:hypothetical protein